MEELVSSCRSFLESHSQALARHHSDGAHAGGDGNVHQRIGVAEARSKKENEQNVGSNHDARVSDKGCREKKTGVLGLN